MAFKIKGFRTVDFMFDPDGVAGANLGIHKYVTADDRAAVETAGYFNALAKRVKAGDHIDATLGFGGAIMRRNYVVTVVTSTAVTVAAQNIAA
ncbi:hypothetical protein ACRQ1B_06085 [Rhizobium panacihumi]|uniref:hypothetical protein n=1 Tax=Rhizobium panacihumi TaxID=2008450 RepID=UPI003D7921A3